MFIGDPNPGLTRRLISKRSFLLNIMGQATLTIFFGPEYGTHKIRKGPFSFLLFQIFEFGHGHALTKSVLVVFLFLLLLLVL